MAKLFSIKERYSNKIYSKEKLVEFRRQNVDVKEGEFCLIYTSSPVKKITGYFIVKEKIRTGIQKFSRALSLEDLRKEVNFRPPQSYYNLNDLLIELFSGFVPQKQLKLDGNSLEIRQ